MLPAFPIFAPLSLDQRASFQRIIDRYPPYSDFNFTSLFSWNISDQTQVSLLDQNLIIRGNDYINGTPFLSLIGESELLRSFETLFAYCRVNGLATVLRLIPGAVINQLPPSAQSRYVLHEDLDSHDYILSVKELVDFRTNQYRGKKNAYNRFVGQHGVHVISHVLDLSSPVAQKQIITVVKKWQQSRNKADRDVSNEFLAIKRCLEHHNQLGVRAFGTHIGRELVAFTLFELVPHHMALIHFDKADTRHIGVFEHLKHSFARYLQSLNVAFINYEQDLGLPGLRLAKQAYKPSYFLKKYTVSLKETHSDPIGSGGIGQGKQD